MEGVSRSGPTAAQSRLAFEKEYLLEHPFLKIPYEGLNKTVRGTQRLLEKEISAVLSAIVDIGKKTDTIPKNEAQKTVDTLITRLQTLKRKLAECGKSEEAQVQRNRGRLQHLGRIVNIASADESLVSEWKANRVDRVIADYMLREGHYDSATTFAH
jgi:macrophage erythroblast attacher